jgi:myosin heavy subunit
LAVAILSLGAVVSLLSVDRPAFAAGAAVASADQVGHHSVLAKRIADAVRLNACGRELLQGTDSLRWAALELLADGKPLEGDVSRDQFRSYSEILSAYHDALNAYLQHRQEVQQHAAQFHQIAQAENVIDVPIQVKPFKPLRVESVDECALLQLQEKQLTQLEFQLRGAIQALIAQKGQTAPEQMQTQTLNLQSTVIEDQNAALAFERSVVKKQNLTNRQVQDQVHAAVNAGDYVQSQQVYSESQRRTALVNGEMQRAAMHINLARAFMGKLSLVTAAQSATDGQPANVNFADADAQLAAEYAHVQELYGELQKARLH